MTNSLLYSEGMVIPAETGLVSRWVIVCGTRTVYTNPQHTYATEKEGTQHRDSILTENSKDKLESVFGKNPVFTVREVLCRKVQSGGFEPVAFAD